MVTIHKKVTLAGVETERNYQTFSALIEELASLMETANEEVVFVLTQKRPQIDRQTVIGKGKLEELIQLTDAYEAGLVIFNRELTPRQNQLLSEALAVRVIDRVQLILDIFALRARSKGGKLQVELAQLDYLLPRLAGQGKQLSRLGGGIGTRGPGETKLELDRRHIRNKILGIRRELKEVTVHRERSRQKRQNSELFRIGLIGYTNVGKSTILNILTTAETYSKDQLFATLNPLTKKWQLPQGMEVTLTDMVGLTQDLPTQLIEAFQSTLEESRTMDPPLHVVDASASDRLQHEHIVQVLMKELASENIPYLTVYNKGDQVDSEEFVSTLFPNALISTKISEDKGRLVQAIHAQMMELLKPYQLEISPTDGQLLSELRRMTLMISEEYAENENRYIMRGFAKKKPKWLVELEKEQKMVS